MSGGPPARWLSIDPGETVGWTLWAGARKVDGGQTPWHAFLSYLIDAWGIEASLSPLFEPDGVKSPQGVFIGVIQLVVEDYLQYPEGVGPGPAPPWDQLITARVIGAIQAFADLADVPVAYQGANIKERALAGGAQELFARPLHPNRHENDSTMHGVYWLANTYRLPAGIDLNEQEEAT